MKWDLLARNPIDRVDRPRYTPPPPEILSRKEVDAFLAVVDEANGGAGDRLGALYHLVVRTGLREGEALALKWHNLDLPDSSERTTERVAGLVRVEDSVNRQGKPGDGKVYWSGHTKTRRYRAVDIGPGWSRA